MFFFKKVSEKMMLRLPWAIFYLPDCKMYLWKHRSLPLAFFFCRNFVSWGFRLPRTARGVECRWYAMCFCYPKFRWVFCCTFAPYIHQDAWGGGGRLCFLCLKLRWNQQSRWNTGISMWGNRNQTNGIEPRGCRCTRCRLQNTGAAGNPGNRKLGTFIEGLKFLKVSPVVSRV